MRMQKILQRSSPVYTFKQSELKKGAKKANGPCVSLGSDVELVMCERRIMMNEAVRCAHVAQHLQLESHRIRECNYFDANSAGDTIDRALWRHSSIAL